MRTITVLIIALLSFSASKAQNLSEQLEKMLKSKVQTVVEEEKEQKKVENALKEKDVIKAELDSLKIVKQDLDSIVGQAVVVADTLPQISAKDSLAKEDMAVANLAVVIDTVGYKKREWEAKSHKLKNITTEEEWQKKYFLSNINKYDNFHVLDTNVNVFGWHPYWMGNAYQNYNFSLLTHIAYFSYELNPQTGNYNTVHNWQTTPLIDSAKAYNCKTLLTVTNFGKTNNEIFLSNRNNQQKVLIDNLITLLRERDADGVCIDFEEIPTKMRNNFSNFVIDLSRSLQAANNKFIVTMAIPMKDFNEAFDVKNLISFVDLFVIMGYEFYGKYSKVAGPVAPISSGDIWWEYNIEGSILEYKVAGIPPKQLLLGVPYYGVEWQTRNLTFPSKVVNFSGYYTYRDIKRKFNDVEAKKDVNSNSSYHVFRDRNNRYYQLWYEDTSALAAKYDLVGKYQIGGIGIWALGYDNGYPETWELIAKKFALSPEEAELVLAAIEEKKGKGGKTFKKVLKLAKKAAKNPMALLKSPGPLIKVFGAMFGVGVVGLLLVLKMAKKMKKTFMVGAKGGLIGLVFAMVLIITKMLKFFEVRELLLIVGGFLLGGILLFILTYKYIIRDKDLP